MGGDVLTHDAKVDLLNFTFHIEPKDEMTPTTNRLWDGTTRTGILDLTIDDAQSCTTLAETTVLLTQRTSDDMNDLILMLSLCLCLERKELRRIDWRQLHSAP